MTSLKDIQEVFYQELNAIYSTSEIRVLFQIFCEEYLNLSHFQLNRDLNSTLNRENYSLFLNAISQLKEGKPYQQILGKAAFFGKEFYVNEHTLIPRPETEELIELLLKKIDRKRSYKILDIGTGSGCIPITLALELENSKISGLDVSQEALSVAKKNADFHQVKIQWILSDFLNENLKEPFDIIISNPPYIGKEEEENLDIQVKNFEPHLALFTPENDPLIFYKKIAENCSSFLLENGFIFLEINQKYGEETLDLFKNQLSEVHLEKDISENYRFIWGRK